MYVVTGASGNTGSIVARRLLAKGQKVRVVGRNAEHLKPFKGADPFIADVADAAALTKAFTGAKAVYVMVPPNLNVPDYRSYQKRVASAIAEAIENSHIEYAVSLSSVGADKSDKTGPIAGLHELEQELNNVPGLNVLHIRAAFFMENILAQIGIVRSRGIAAESLRPNLVFPMIATRDIGDYAAERLLKLDFRKQEVRELLGQRDLTMTEVAHIIGGAIGRPDLKYVQLQDDQVRESLTQVGFSRSAADLILEMAAGMNSGHIAPLEPRSALNTTPTSIETFVNEEFVPLYQKTPAAA